MSEEMRSFGYLCPECGRTVLAARSVFALEASNAEIECECGKSALRVTFDGAKYHAYVPCGICGETHEAVVPPERMLTGATALGCARTKQFCCFVGPEGVVEKNLRELAVLAEKDLVTKERYGKITLTETGAALAHQLQAGLRDLERRLPALGLDLDREETAAVAGALASVLPEHCLRKLCTTESGGTMGCATP